MTVKTPIILTSTLRANRGGRTMATLNRANMLAEYFEKVIIITMEYQRCFNEDSEKIYKQNNLNENVEIINFIDDLRKRNTKSHLKLRFNKRIKGLKNLIMKFKFRMGLKDYPVKNKKYDKSNRLTYIEYINESNYCYKKEEYDENGKLYRVSDFDINNKNIRTDRYMNDNGNCYLTVELDGRKENFTVYSNKEKTNYSKLAILQSDWLEGKLKGINNPVIFCEVRRLDKMLMQVKSKEIKKIAVIHTTHLSNPRNDINKVRRIYRRLFKRHTGYNKIIVLTKEQKADINQIYHLGNKIEVIPHAYEKPPVEFENHGFKRKDNKTIVTMARYHKVKRIDEAIKAFRIVVDHIPDAIYNIYGRGAMKNELQSLINELNLKQNVFLKGYCRQPHLAYRTAMCSVLTSQYEGFGLVVTESLAEGTPVVAYDIKYGPNEMIQNGKNGYLVEDMDRKTLANKIIKILEDPEHQNELSENAFKIRKAFSEESYKCNWLNLIDEI